MHGTPPVITMEGYYSHGKQGLFHPHSTIKDDWLWQTLKMDDMVKWWAKIDNEWTNWSWMGEEDVWEKTNKGAYKGHPSPGTCWALQRLTLYSLYEVCIVVYIIDYQWQTKDSRKLRHFCLHAFKEVKNTEFQFVTCNKVEPICIIPWLMFLFCFMKFEVGTYNRVTNEPCLNSQDKEKIKLDFLCMLWNWFLSSMTLLSLIHYIISIQASLLL